MSTPDSGNAPAKPKKSKKVVTPEHPVVAPPAPTQPAPSSVGLGGLFSGKIAAPTVGGPKKKGSKAKPIEEISTELVPQLEVMVGGKMVSDAILDKIKAATGAVKQFAMKRFAELWSLTGTRPPTFTLVGGRARYDYIQTKRIYPTPERVQALRDMNIDIDAWTIIKGVNINFEAIQRHGLLEKLQTALGSMGVSEAVMAEIFVPKHDLKDGFFDQLLTIVKASLQDGETLSDKMFLAMLALEPVNQTKNPTVDIVGETEELRLQNAFKMVLETNIEAEDVLFEDDDEDDDDDSGSGPTSSERKFTVASSSGEGSYTVIEKEGKWSCTCPHFQKKKVECKHIKSVK